MKVSTVRMMEITTVEKAMDAFLANVNWSQPSLWIFLASATFNPVFWNTVARLEYHYALLTRYVGCGNAYRGCYVLAVTIFTLGLVRDALFKWALEEQPTSALLAEQYTLWVLPVAGVLFVCGNVFVVSSMWQLGVTGTYLGDYFGILMKERVTAFPFSVMENPMYNGSTMIFTATALWWVQTWENTK